MPHLTRIGVVRGGPSNEYEVSLNSGANVLSALRKHFEHRYQPRDVFVDRDGRWHIDGISILPQELATKVDIVFNALHGTFGEDGKVQAFFESHGIPFTGSGSLGSAIGMNKIMAKKILADHGIKSPQGRHFTAEEIHSDMSTLTHNLFHNLLLPVVVKPNASGSSVGVSIVRQYAELPAALLRAVEHDDIVLIEEFIPGIESTVGVVEDFRGHRLYALPPVEIRSKNGFFDYAAKYQGQSDEIVPATFAQKTKLALEDIARRVHEILGLRHYSRTDFMIHPRRGIYVLEANTLPGLTDESLVPKALRAVGSDTHEFVAHIIELAREGR